MTQAINQPVQRARRETLSSDIPLPQKSPIDLGATLDSPVDRDQVLEGIDAQALHDGYAEALAFNEEPITIVIHPSREKNPPMVVDCWVQGKGAEVRVNGKWTPFGCLPINIPVVTRRKYAEVLAMSRTDNINTYTGSQYDENPVNTVRRTTSANATFSVLQDDNPKGAEWLRRIMNQPI